MITVTTPCQDVKPNTFMIEGKCAESVALCHVDKGTLGCAFMLSGPLESFCVTECNPSMNDKGFFMLGE